MKKIVSILLAVLLLSTVTIAVAENEYEGLWVSNSGPLVVELKINEDNTCSWIWMCFVKGAKITEMPGTWKLKGNKLSVSTKKGTVEIPLTDTQSVELTIKEQTIEYSITDGELSGDGYNATYVKIPERKK